MKKLFVLLIIFCLAACSNQSVFLSGSSKHWEGQYSANIEGNREDGTFIFGYKNANKNTNFKNLQVIIENSSGKSERKEEDHKGATIRISHACSGCAVIDASEPMKVTIKWNDKNEEIFYLKKK
ncbi:hypothetical protein E2K98_07500 [Bacillus salipaludis]|uniref:Lipoprotein n=1 Tax=Bacillus salipaludis TaxID=2547811 RepID=A0A4R5VXW7_9BACI|nr:hypothetical protein [Bacillus salipaludis]MDQ6597275.1 hypothetical protein [Bacillus salipaludis]TDK63281.1 hypothetical protein E2K98_07500 [Bacillus salipaludis]